MNELLEAALNGRAIAQVFDGQKTSAVAVRSDEKSRDDIEAIGEMLVDTEGGEKVPLLIRRSGICVRHPACGRNV